ncbi:MAG: tRNA (adenosine(37)-N6)-threonylcarbamoyltransferase complex transferase subunit TsaD [Chloroflexi bacterium]|nr:tRNA (adenosine(37)-N6)-threonylcarbamoyltransferase complex transferase subunit TsaD [Chloroflexota bacterium]
MRVLAIESSCDETAAAIVEDGRTLRSSVVASQVAHHEATGGVVPEVASRQHVAAIVPVVDRALAESDSRPTDIDLVAATNGPGLAGSLLVGLSAAKALAWAWNAPFLGVNHLVGHIYANWLGAQEPVLPAVCLVVSGGHTELIWMEKHLSFTSLGRTRDDAAGEAFDKVARILDLGYPGGPAIERTAATVDQSGAIVLPRAWLEGSWDFSFSGLKTAVMRLVAEEGPPPALVARGFQDAVVEVLARKTVAAADTLGAKSILLAGGVAANSALRSAVREMSRRPCLAPSPPLCTDNAAMIAAAACFLARSGHSDDLSVDAFPSLDLPDARSLRDPPRVPRWRSLSVRRR